MNPRETLLYAARIVAETIKHLDLARDTCGKCGVVHYSNFQQYMAHKELTAAAAKIERIAKGAAFEEPK